MGFLLSLCSYSSRQMLVIIGRQMSRVHVERQTLDRDDNEAEFMVLPFALTVYFLISIPAL